MEEKERQKRAEELLVGEEISNLSSQEGAEKRPVSEETVHIAESVAALEEEEEQEHLEDRVKMLSPGAVVAKRFFRSKLSVIGLITLIVLFVFSRLRVYRFAERLQFRRPHQPYASSRNG